MSIFSELLPKFIEISNSYVKNFDDDLKSALECLDKFEEDFNNGKNRAREIASKSKPHKATLQSIHEDEVDKNTNENKSKRVSKKKSVEPIAVAENILDNNNTKTKSDSKKRNKADVDGMSSPEPDKRQKRNASVKAQSIITKQERYILKVLNENGVVIVEAENAQRVNANLTQKLRREESSNNIKNKHHTEDSNKENNEPLIIKIKQEKLSIPAEPMETELLPVNVKQELNKDDFTMPPPVAPIPKPRKNLPKDKSEESTDDDTTITTDKKRSTRNRRQNESQVTENARPSRSTRNSSRITKQQENSDHQDPMPPPPAEARPKRTRAKKKLSETSSTTIELEKDVTTQEVSSPAVKPRPKRTRRGQKAVEKQDSKTKSDAKEQEVISPKEERVSEPQNDASSPILQAKKGKNNVTDELVNSKLPLEDTVCTEKDQNNKQSKTSKVLITKSTEEVNLEDTRVLAGSELNSTVNLDGDKTMVIVNGVYNHAPIEPTIKNAKNMNETVVLETCNQTVVLDKPHIMDATVVLDKDPKPANITDDNSLLTDDSDCNIEESPPRNATSKPQQPSSAVKEKVQQFEEMASRVTRTKTRAMAKKVEEPETQTPPDKISKAILSAETLNKMNDMIFNGKAHQTSSSACKPRVNVVPTTSKIPSSTSKVTVAAVNKAREEEEKRKERDDARRKKEMLLEAKKEQQKRKREDKMAAAAAVREAAERERREQLELAAKEKMEKQAHADQGRKERLKEAERKKLELARKAAETEDRRRAAEERARQLRAAEDAKREDERRKRQDEADKMKREAALMAKEIEKRQKEYLEKQRLKQSGAERHTPLRTPARGSPLAAGMPPVHMSDGFEFLNSDEEAEPAKRAPPPWSTSEARHRQLSVQGCVSACHVDRLFGVRGHSPDLRAIFPCIERARLKRTSSAVWRTPPQAPPRLPRLHE